MGRQLDDGHSLPRLSVGRCVGTAQCCFAALGRLTIRLRLVLCVCPTSQMLMSLGVTLTVVQSGTTTTMTVEQVYANAQSNVPSTLIVSMTIPNLVGITAKTPGPYAIDSFKVTLRKQNTHALCSAGFVLNFASSSVGRGVRGPTPTVSSARMFFGAVGKEIFRATQTEAAITGQPMNQATLNACFSALSADIAACGASDYYGTTDAYRQQTAAALLYKVCCVCAAVSRMPSSRTLFFTGCTVPL